MPRLTRDLGALGIVGGGQLARMTALAARSMGFAVHAFAPGADCPVAPVVDSLTVAGFDDLLAARQFAAACDVVTLEVEHVPCELLSAMSTITPVRPGPAAVHIIQDRGRQKQWLEEQGLPVGPYRIATGAEQLQEALRELGEISYVKAAVGGFDGRGQCIAHAGSNATQLLTDLRSTRVTVERALHIEAELSVLVARRPSSELVVFPGAYNHHERGLLSYSLLPAPLPASVLQQAAALAERIVRRLDIVGLCAVELFLLHDGTLLVNELAPRPHNSYHGSESALETGQFEQHVRAVFDLPLGPVGIVRPTAMANLFGDLWLGLAPPDFQLALQVSGVRAHLYGKREARRGRKLGHLTATGTTVQDALERVLLAKRALRSADA